MIEGLSGLSPGAIQERLRRCHPGAILLGFIQHDTGQSGNGGFGVCARQIADMADLAREL
jgi:hypothetical protein